ncbi:translocase [Shimia sediminis]|uniref:translocase n=1 Tax=Shimia sediminis TaxID=2497945 RepID=UPI000F8DF2B8|nr:translocase [Shimia sediminis]
MFSKDMFKKGILKKENLGEGLFKKDINVYRRYAWAGASFSAAMSIAFLMQQSEASYAGQVLVRDTVVINPDDVIKASLPAGQMDGLQGVETLSTLPSLPQELSHQSTLPTQPVILLVSRDIPVGVLPQEEASPLLNCDATLTAEPVAAAMVDLTLSAPCLSGERVTIHHGGLKFTEVLGLDGTLNVSVPALAEHAMFVVAFTNGDGAVARADVSSLPFYDRVAVQWMGETGLQLHALEYGASYGEDGHVWQGTPRDLTAVAAGEGGFITRLGNQDAPEPLMVEVYTFPTATAREGGQISISLEAEVSSVNCGRDISATSLELQGEADARVQDLTLAMPDCDAKGEFLVLKNLFEDLTIARK